MGWLSHTPIERSMAAVSTASLLQEQFGKTMVQAKARSGKIGALQV